MLQIRTPNGLPYAVHRDLVNAFTPIAAWTARSIGNKDPYSPVEAWITQAQISESSAAHASGAFAEFINNVNDPAVTSVAEALVRSGFSSLPLPAQVMFLARLGEVFTYFSFSCARDAMEQESRLPGARQFLRDAGDLPGDAPPQSAPPVSVGA